MKTKIATFVSLGVALLLVITVMVMYFVPVNYSPNLPSPDKIIITKSSTQSASISKTENAENYDKVLSAFNNSYSRSLLSAIFAGQTQGGQNMTSKGQLPGVNALPTMSGYNLTYVYNEPQTLVVNGFEQSVKVTKVVFEITDNDLYKETSLYFLKNGTTSSYYQMVTYSSQGNLYEIIDGLVIPE